MNTENRYRGRICYTASPGGRASRAGSLLQPPSLTAGPAHDANWEKEGEYREDVTSGNPSEGNVAAATASSVAGGAAGAQSTRGAAQPSSGAGLCSETDAMAAPSAAAGAASGPEGSLEGTPAGEARKCSAIEPASGDGGTLDVGVFIEKAAPTAAAPATAASAAIVCDVSSSSSSSAARRSAGEDKGVSKTAGHAAKARPGSRVIPVCPVSEHPLPGMTPSPEAENMALELF